MAPGWLRAIDPRRLFASRSSARVPLANRKLPRPRIVALIVLGAFVAGIGTAWVTWIVAESIANRAEPSPSPSSSPSASPSESPGIIVPIDQYPPITRELDSNDLYSGLNDLNIPLTGSGVYEFAAAIDAPDPTKAVRLVRVEVEDGLPLAPDAVGVFVLSILNDERGWTEGTPYVFGLTTGVPEFRIVFANPGSVDGICPRPHEALEPPITIPDEEKAVEPSPTASPSPTETTPPLPPSCAEQGIVVVNAYDWAAGLPAFGDDRQSARAYLINHFLGHLLEKDDVECPAADALAPVMVDQDSKLGACRPNAWPNPIVE